MPATILCIDDELPSLEAHKHLLETRGHKVFTALSGDVGIRTVQSQKFDAVILDYWMSPTNGLAIAAQLKQLDSSIPVLMLSAFTSLPDEFVGLADSWVLKGTEPEAFLDKLDQILRKHCEAGMKNAMPKLAMPSEPQGNPE